MTLQTAPRQKIIALLDELPSEALSEVADFMEFLRVKAKQKDAAYDLLDEAELLKIINPPQPPQKEHRYLELRQKFEDEQITESEHQELLTRIQRVEDYAAARAEAIVALARLRGQPPQFVFQEFTPLSDEDAK